MRKARTRSEWCYVLMRYVSFKREKIHFHSTNYDNPPFKERYGYAEQLIHHRKISEYMVQFFKKIESPISHEWRGKMSSKHESVT